MRPTKKKERSAGFIIVRESQKKDSLDKWEVLGLRVWGKIDIPKGHLEENEDDFTAARRECHEEAGIDVSQHDMRWGDRSFISSRPHKDVIIFLAKTDQEPVIKKNPETNKFEHDGYVWLSWDQIKQMSYPYLKNAFDWAKLVAEGHS
jgi:8-oxo-dGTP pyrophosphatase MutT (NUDIX family)